jgi:site-specific recombinase XerD
LRHSMATHQMMMGTNPRVVQEILGHSTVNITLATYSHVMQTLHEDASRKMDAFFPTEEAAS